MIYLWIVCFVSFFFFSFGCAEKDIPKNIQGLIFWILAVFYLILAVISLAFMNNSAVIQDPENTKKMLYPLGILFAIMYVLLSFDKEVNLHHRLKK